MEQPPLPVQWRRNIHVNEYVTSVVLCVHPYETPYLSPNREKWTCFYVFTPGFLTSFLSAHPCIMPPSALVTGASGLLGRQVLKAFESAGYEVTGTGFSRASPPKVVKVDIQQSDEVERLVDAVK